MQYSLLTQVWRALSVVAIIALTAGCATSNKTAKDYSFFPGPPDEPHLQFLTAFNSEKGFSGHKELSLMDFVTNQRQGDKGLSKPYGVVCRNHKFYICDTDLGAVVVADLQTKRMSLFAAHGQGTLKLPLNLTIDDDGLFYVADSERNQVVIFDKDQNYVAAIGKIGEMKPRDVVVSKDRIYVADIQSHSVHVLDKATRTNLFEIPRGADATNAMKRLFIPTNLALDAKGQLYVGDTGGFHVQVYDADGNYLRSVGGLGDNTGQFARVKGVAVDREDRLYAVDAMSQAVQIFDGTGKLLTVFGEPGVVGVVQNLPAKVAVDYEDVGYFKKFIAPGFEVEYLVVVINQLGGHAVSVYGFGHNK